MKRWLSFLLAALVAVVALLSSRPVFADEAAARAHFGKGIDLYDKKQFQGALAEFEAAYREKPSAGIKQNIALSLKGLNRPADAATALDEALDEGKDTLKPETKQAIDRELTDLSKVVATVLVTISGADEKRTAETVVTIQPAGQAVRSLAPGAQRRPIRLMPGMYTFTAKIPGVLPGEPKKLALISGAPTEITFGDAAAIAGASTLNVHANTPDAVIKIDGVEVGTKGAWQGPVAPNRKLRIEVTAPNHKPLAFDITVPASSTVDSPVTLQPIGGAPGEYPGGTVQPEKPRGRVYLALNAAVEGSSYRLSQAANAPTASGLRQGYVGGSLGGRFGFLYSKYMALEALLEFGAAGANLKPGGGTEVKSVISHFVLMPVLRFQTPGRVRFTTATGLGIQAITLKNEVSGTAAGTGTSSTAATSLKAEGVSYAWLLDAGIQFDIGVLWLEAAALLDVHGVGTMKEDVTERRAFLASPAIRAGLRVGFGIPF